MPHIQQLSASVITKIAAGEVIERPASVVKELLENAVDAGSSRIDVEVEQGGTELIRVVDNGCGIPRDELPLAFASHATSKLTCADDLFRVATLGFRGEALASVGGVARVTLQSRQPGEVCGAEITCHGGQLSAGRAWNGAPGTRIEVRHLFYNTPVRRKFLRGTATELGHITEAFTRLALSRLALHLTLRHNGKLIYEVPASAGLLDRIGLFFGKEVRDRLYPLQAEQGPVTLAGYVADPSCERGNAGLQHWFVNGRWVRDRHLSQALHEAYRGLLMTGRFAVAFLFLDLPPDRVDVNVHPTKAEVRFRDKQALQKLVSRTVRDRLTAEDLTADLRAPTIKQEPAPTPAPELAFGPPDPATPSAPVLPAASLPQSAERRTPAPPPGPEGKRGGKETPPGTVKAIQLHDLYLVVEVPEGMLVIDQHALHERVLFQQFQERVRSGALETQRLLIPEPVELPAGQAALALEHRDDLAALGLGVEDFGRGTLLLTSYPALLGKRPPREVLRAVVDYLVSREKVPSREQLLNDLLSLMACHAAVRAGDRLIAEEIAALVAQRHLADDSHHCPHGRPTSLLFRHHELERQFRRV
jgi:DNA mismatch repair protein MutL